MSYRHALILLLAALFVYVSYAIIIPQRTPPHDVYYFHTEILQGTALSPYRYRILAPALVNALASDRSQTGIMTAYAVAHALVFPALLLSLYGWLRSIASNRAALCGALLMAALMPVGFRDYALSLYTPLEAMFVCLALLLLNTQVRGQYVLYSALIVLAVLNRETGVLLAPLWSLWNYPFWRERAYRLVTLWLLLLALATYGLARLALGGADHVMTIAQIVDLNRRNLPMIINQGAVMMPCWILAAWGWRRSPARLKRAFGVALLYMALLLVFALWHEVRLQWTVSPILLGIAVSALEPRNEGVSESVLISE